MSDQIKALFIGDHFEQIAEVRECLGPLEIRHVGTFDELLSLVGSPALDEYQVAFTVGGLTDVPTAEMAQLLRVALQRRPLYFVTFDMGAFDRGVMIKNGYNEAFLMPVDRDQLIRSVGRVLRAATDEVFSSVRLVDIEPDTELEFEVAVFLPLNNKHVSLIRQGDRLVQERLDRLKAHKQNTIFVPVNQMQAFYDYSARRLIELEDGARSSTEKAEKLQASIRDFVTGIVSASYSRQLSQGKQTTDNIRKVIDKYIVLKSGDSWYEKISGEIGQTGDSYSHASRVSTFAALFAMALRVANAQDVAVAGVLHDLGVMLLPPQLQSKSELQMSRDESEQYKAHPLLSLQVIQDRKLPLNDDIILAVTQHHERYAGGGYPENLTGRRVKLPAQILALADRFDYLTRVEANLSPLDVEQAMARMSAEGVAHSDLHNELRRLFKRSLASHKAAA